MAEEQQFKRNTAYKLRLGDLLIGKPVFDAEKFSFLELGNKKIIRVNIVGNIVEKYEGASERKYLVFTIDDGSGQIKARVFGEDVEKFAKLSQGQTVMIIGVLRSYNNETYLNPEIIKEQDSKYLLIRKLELEKERAVNTPPLQKEQIIALKDEILDLIKKREETGGIDHEEIIIKIRGTSPEIINQEIKKLLEEGIIFEPRPGKLRWLG
jgi:RPA family protein